MKASVFTDAVALGRATKAIAHRWSAKLTKALPDTKLIDLQSAGHYVFLTRETEVIRGIRDFLAGLN